ncbi:hypothetical protein ACP6H1_27420 [Vibrio harveyi]|uniref:hypothetical protein n=1 Tax=Vibrio harveyi TaxID=669 RepID=UPI003CF87C7B
MQISKVPNSHPLKARVLDLADMAAERSGDSYEDYIRLFTRYVDQSFEKKSRFLLELIKDYGYAG